MTKRLILLVLVGLCTIASTATVASASRGIGYSPAATRTTSTGTVTFSAAGINIICSASTTSLPALTSKVVNSPSTTGVAATAANCNLGAAVVYLNMANWQWHYVSFTGTLPNITSVRYIVRDVQVLINVPGFLNCLFRGPVPLIFTPPNIHTWGAAVLPLDATQRLNTSCPASINYAGGNNVGNTNYRLILL